jgi:hypothetical protein
MVDAAQSEVFLVVSYVLLITAGIMTGMVGYFVFFEAQLYRSSGGKMRTKFVVLTLILGFTSTCSTWLNTFLYFKYGLEILNELNAPDTILNIFTASAHVYLLYLRTLGLFSTSPKLAKVLKFLGMCFGLLSTFSILVGVFVFVGMVAPQINQRTSNVLFFYGTLTMALCLILIDLISTFAFAKQVAKQSESKTQLVLLQDTQIIARMGLGICLLSVLTFVFYTFSYISQAANFQIISAAGFILTGNCIAGLWIVMKIWVDSLRKNDAGTASQTCLQWFQRNFRYSNLKTDRTPAEALLSSEQTPIE